MPIIPRSLRYTPHDLNTKFHACKTYSSNKFSVKDVCRLYHCSKASLMRWMNRFDTTKESLISKSKRPLTPHPNSHNLSEIKCIKVLLKRNPTIGLSELYGKLKQNYAYTRHPASLFRFLRRQKIFVHPETTKSKYTPKPYCPPSLISDILNTPIKFYI